MRGLVEDTKKLSLTNNNNNSSSTSGSSSSSTSSASKAGRATTSSSSSKTVTRGGTATTPTTTATTTTTTNSASNQLKNNKTRKTITTTKQTMQPQQQQQQVNAIKTSSKAAAVTASKSSPSPSSSSPSLAKGSNAGGALSKAQNKNNHQQQQQKQQKPQPAQQQQQQYNNNSHTIAIPKASHANTNEEIAGGVQDTIYLCNFRVSVDGEWLCLKELQDIDVIGGQQQTTSGNGSDTILSPNNHGNNGIGGYQQQQKRQAYGQKNKRFSGLSTHGFEDNGILAIENLIGRRLYDGGSSALNAHNNIGLIGPSLGLSSGEWSNQQISRDTAEIERSNLVNICKLVVKELLEQSLRYGRMLDSDHLPLQHFFIVIEHVLGHGLRPKKGLLGPRKELWDLLQSVENYCPESQDITASVRDLPTVRTPIGRARAWLRIALMQKKLSDYLQALIEHRDDTLYDYYEPQALMMSDEIVVIMGILVGLNVIDCNLCVKEEDLDSQQGVIDFSLYLRSSSRNNDTNNEETNQALDATREGNMIAVLDQKNYIEELNRHLNATVANMQAKVESLTTTNALMKEDLAIARNSLLALQAENQAMRQVAANQSSTLLQQQQHQQLRQQQQQHQSDSSSTSSNDNKISIETLNAEIAEERRRNAELDKELKLQISLKAESDMAMKLLEKDIHEKQDTIISLRRQLDDIKQINLEMYRKLQDCDASLKHKSELLTKLENQKEDMAAIIEQLEKKWTNDKSNLGEILKNTSQTLSTQVTASEERAARAEAESRIEREWRVTLQEKETKLKEKITTLQNCVKELNDEKQQNEKLKFELEKVRTQWTEAQTTLEELGIQLSVSKLKIAELQETEKRQQKLLSASTTSLQASEGVTSPGIWAPDSIVSHCTTCKREFNLTRRKHHCRSCGDIFCRTCSEHTLALLNEYGQPGKPVRVCDGCYAAANK